jgi:predicted RNA-binding protein with EMAP domain
MNKKYHTLFLENVRNFIGTLPNEDQGKINATIVAMESVKKGVRSLSLSPVTGNFFQMF